MRFSSKLLLIFFLAALASAQRRMGRDQDGAFRFRFVGPIVGNRVAAVAGVPGDASTYYAGAASGGIFKSTDGGNNWTPIFDKESVTAIGALAVAPSDHNVVWAGTGEAWVIRDSDVMGNGIYKSTDAGKTWTRMGLDETGRIGRIIVNPTNPDIVFACAVGRATGPQQERGVFRTLDGGAHWDRVLFADQNTGCSGLSLDPHNPRVLFAGMWQLEMHSWGEFSGGPGSGIYVSRDGGTKWTRIEAHGLPKSPVGKIDVAVAPTNSNRVYALIQTKDQGSLWRSDDGGENWKVVNWDRALIGRAGYYIRLAVSPVSDNEVLVANSSFHQSLDGGETFHSVPWGGDNHDIWIDPTNADRFMISDDAGLTITTVHGRGSHRVQLPIGQMYHVAVDNQIPYYVYGNMQDNSTMRGPSIAPPGAGYGRPQEYGWEHRLGGCESGFTIPDYTDPNIVWASCYGDEVTRWDGRTKLARSVSPWLHTLDSPPNATKYRCHWTAPLAIDPFDHNTVYFGCQVIFQTSNGGSSWSVISPDLSTQDPTRNGPSGGLVGDNLGQFYGEVVFAIAPSPLEKGLIWAGTNDGLVWIKRASGEWTNVSKNIAGLPAWGSVTSISPSTFDAGTAYVSVDFHLNDNRDPFIYKTRDFGKTWTKISDGLPKHELSYVRCVTEDPNQKGLLFAGTGNALYYSLDDGAKWTALQEGLPHAPVTWVTVQKQFHDLVVSTYGRGFYILDDITPLEQMAKEPTTTSVRFFPPRPAYRFLSGQRAYLDFALKAKPKDDVKIAILDPDGKVVNELKASGHDGLNRQSWDLHYAKFKLVELRTTPPENPHIWSEPRFRDADSRPITHWGAEEAEVGPIAAPGKYTARLTVDGETYAQALEILPDPASTANQQQIEAAVKLQLRIRDDINVTSEMVNRIEWMRKQLDDVQKMLKSPQGKADLLPRAQEMDQKLQNVEYKLITRSLALSDDKYFVEAYNVYFNLIWLNGEVGTGGGDVAGGADYGPTETSRVLLDNIEKDLNTAKSEYADLMDKQVPAFNQWLGENGMVPLAGK
jgi:photosystem II stability/assembly factor-like uncharacterized protein